MARPALKGGSDARPLDPALRTPSIAEQTEGGFAVSVAALPLLALGVGATVAVGALWPDSGPLVVAPLAFAAAAVAWLFYRHSIEGRIRHRTRALRRIMTATERLPRAEVGREILRVAPEPPRAGEAREPVVVNAARFFGSTLPSPAPARGFDRDPDAPRFTDERAVVRAIHHRDGAAFADGRLVVPLVNAPTGRRASERAARPWLTALAFVERFADREAAWLVALALTETEAARFGGLIAAIARRAEDAALIQRMTDRALEHPTPAFRRSAAANLGRVADLERMLAEPEGAPPHEVEALLQIAWRETDDRGAVERWAGHPSPAVRHAVGGLSDVPRAVLRRLLDDDDGRVAARAAAPLLAGPPDLALARRVLDRPDFFGDAPHPDGLRRALDLASRQGAAQDLPRIVRWVGRPPVDDAARRARDRLRARFADALGAGGLAVAADAAVGGLALDAADAPNGRR